MYLILALHLFLPNSVHEISWYQNSEPVALHLEAVIQEGSDYFIGAIIDASISNNEDILVVDYAQKKVFVFDKNGSMVSNFGRQGRGPGEFLRPAAIGIDNKGNVYIEDSGNARISVWNSKYDYITDIDLKRGWRPKFKKNSDGLYLSIKPFSILPNGNDAFIIYEIQREKPRLKQHFVYEFNAAADWFDVNRQFDSTSHWDITDNGKIVASGKYDLSTIRIINIKDGKVENEFNNSLNLVYYTKEENELRLERVSPRYRELKAQRTVKPFYTGIEISDREQIWVHRSKQHESPDEIDIYSLNGELLTKLSLPASKNELKILGIYGEKVLFQITTPDGKEKLHVYRIEYRQ